MDADEVRTAAEIACTLGRAFEDVGRREEALECYERGAQLFRESGARDGEALAFAKMAEVYWELGRRDLMVGYARLSLSILSKVHLREAEAALLVLIACAFRAGPGEGSFDDVTLPTEAGREDRDG